MTIQVCVNVKMKLSKLKNIIREEIQKLNKQNVQTRCGLCGDVDGDGQVTSQDASLIMQYIVGNAELPCPEQADVDGDGQITSQDASMIMQYIVGGIDEFPGCPEETVNCTCLPGDLNGDGDVDILDATILENILLGAQNINEVACIGNLPTQANGNFNYMTSIILENLILGQGPTANEYIESGNFYNLNAPSEVVASFTAMGCGPEDICAGLEQHAISLGIQSGVPGVSDTIMTATDQFCIKCQSGSYPNDEMCDCCDTNYTYNNNVVTYDDGSAEMPLIKDPVKDRMKKLAGLKK